MIKHCAKWSLNILQQPLENVTRLYCIATNIINMTSIDKETFVLKMNDECAVIIAEMKDEARSMLNASFNNCKVFSKLLEYCSAIDVDYYRNHGGVARISREIQEIAKEFEDMSCYDARGIENQVCNFVDYLLEDFESAMTKEEQQERPSNI